MKKFTIIFLIVGFFSPSISNAQTTTNAAAAVVMDAETGEVLYARNADAVRPAASLTKLMTAIIFIEHKPRWGMKVKMLKSDEVGGGRLRFPIGTTITARDAFYAALVGSANNSATALARVSGLSREKFIEEMNIRAATLGLNGTHFVDPSGINEENLTTALDITRLARYAFANPDIRTATVTGKYPILKRIITNTNRLLTNDATIQLTGGKTGYLNEALYNLVIRARQSNGREVIVTVLGAPTRTASFEEAKKLALTTWTATLSVRNF